MTSTPGLDLNVNQGRMGPAWRAVLFVVLFVALLGTVNWAIGRKHLPPYGNWTGNLQLETKLRRYAEFAAAGPVDAIVMGSSVTDCGVSVETLTREWERRTGYPIRIFNMAISAGSGSSYALTYRLLREIAKPRELFLVSNIERKGSEEGGGHLDAGFDQAPVGPFRKHPALLFFSKWIWDQPVVRDAMAWSDKVIDGSYYHRTLLYSVDYHPVTALGDSAYRHVADQLDPKESAAHRDSIAAAVAEVREGSPSLPETLFRMYGRADRDGLSTFKGLLARDKVKVTVIPIDAPTIAQERLPPAFYEARLHYHQVLAKYLDARLVNVIDDGYTIFPFERLDFLHLNFAGAERFSRRVAAGLAGQTPDNESWVEPRLENILHSNDPQFNYWSDIVTLAPHSAGTRFTLHLKFVRNQFTENLLPPANAELHIALRLPDNGDRIVRARRDSADEISADFEVADPSHHQAMVVRTLSRTGDQLTAMNLPLENYAWRRTR